VRYDFGQAAMRTPLLRSLLAVIRTVVLLVATVLVGCGGRSDEGSWLPSSLDTDAGVRHDAGVDSGTNDAAKDAPHDGTVADAPSDAPSDAHLALVSLDVTPPLSTLVIGTNVALTATGHYSDGTTADVTALALFTSSSASVATVTGHTVTAAGAGSAVITASLGGVTAVAKIQVSAATITAVSVTPASATTGIGGVVTFSAVAALSDGTHQDVTSSAAWSLSDATVASISFGVAKGLAAGTTSVKASIGSVGGTAKLSVTGATLVSIALTPTNPVEPMRVAVPFQATATYDDQSIADVTATAAWTSSDASIVSIATSGGSATTLAPGTSIITATVGSVSGSTTVTVTAAKLTAIVVTPAATTLAIAGTQQLTATGKYDDGTTPDLTASVTWTSSAAGTASVSNAQGSQGLATALAAGTATVTATLGAVSGSATITVTPATLKTVVITPATASIPIGTALAFVAKGTYSDGSTIDVTTSATWSTKDANIATISNAAGSNGTATGMAAGTTTVQTSLDGVTATASLTVTQATLQTIAVKPANTSLVVGVKQSMTATGTYSNGSQVDLTTTAVWTTANVAIASVSNASGAQGQLTAVGAGTTTVTATASGIAGSTAVTVTEPAASQLVISPTAPSSPTGQRVQFTATVIYTNNTQRNVTMQATWSSSKTSVATINRTGQATTVAAGTTTITATYGGMTATTTLTVSAAVVTQIQVTPINPSFPVGTVQQFQATAIYSDNTSQAVTGQATWTSTKTAVATVTTNGPNRGRVTAVAAGTAQIQASWQGITGSSTVTVTAAVPVSISVSPAAVTVAVGSTRQYAAALIYSDGTSTDVTAQATWTSSAPTVASVSTARGSKGQAKALSAGTATIQAAYQGLTGSGTMTVSAATVVSIDLSPPSPSVPKGVPVSLTATANLSDGTTQNVTGGATWVSSNSAVAQVSDTAGSKGLVTSLGVGQAAITATWSGVSGKTTVTVTSASLVTVQVTPFAPLLPVGFATPFQATGIYSDNTTLDLTLLASWTSSAPAIAAVSDAAGTKGLVTPLAAGGATVTATYQGVPGTDKVTVTTATLKAIAVSPAVTKVAVQGLAVFTATGTFSDGSQLDVTNYVTWLSSGDAIASVSNAFGSRGVAKALSVGTVTITAVRGVQGTAQLTCY
jgi:trimeric autotransporter adhesin